MAKLTAEQKREQQAEQERIRLESTAAYRATIPTRLMAAQGLAASLGLHTSVSLTETGPAVRFYNDNETWDDIATYQMEEWELDHLESRLRELKQEQDDRILRRKQAETTWEKLTPVEKACLKEFIHYLYK